MTETGQHYDEGKPRVDLISAPALIELGRVLGYGSGKYGETNWQLGIKWTKLYGSALRHLLAWRGGEDTDPESGLSHMAHALTNLSMLMHYIATGMAAWDDRRPLPPPPPNSRTVDPYFGPGPDMFFIDKGGAA